MGVGDALMALPPLEDQAFISVGGQFFGDFDGPAVRGTVDEEVLVPESRVAVSVYVCRYGLDDALAAVEAIGVRHPDEQHVFGFQRNLGPAVIGVEDVPADVLCGMRDDAQLSRVDRPKLPDPEPVTEDEHGPLAGQVQIGLL